MAEPLLLVQSLSVSYRTTGGANVFALNEVDLCVLPGQVVGVLGESGSGKSTLAASLLALFPANAKIGGGAVLLQGTNILALNRSELEGLRGNRISIIFQEPSLALHPAIRVGTQIEEVLRAHTTHAKNVRRAETLRLLELIFGKDANRIYLSYPHQLSGGQRQRIAIAQAISCKPDLLIADEPTASLDSVTQREILDLLKKLRETHNLAILFITHSLELLRRFADRAVVMYAGRVIEQGETENLLRSPSHPYTRLLLRCRPKLSQSQQLPTDMRLPVIPGESPDPSAQTQGCAFESRCEERMQVCGERMPSFFEADNGGTVRCFKFGS